MERESEGEEKVQQVLSISDEEGSETRARERVRDQASGSRKKSAEIQENITSSSLFFTLRSGFACACVIVASSSSIGR